MPRDNIVDEAERKKKENSTSDEAGAEGGSDDPQETGDGERERLTQRMPPDLLEDVDKVQEKFRLGSRNATINFMLSHAAGDLLDGDP